jgi:hypothetical protein
MITNISTTTDQIAQNIDKRVAAPEKPLGSCLRVQTNRIALDYLPPNTEA